MKKLAIVAGMIMTALTINASAHDLWQVYQQAQKSDPTYQGAKATWLAAREAIPQSFANLMPQIAVQGDFIAGRTNSREGSAAALGKYSNNSRSYGLTITQPIINFAAFAGKRYANETVKQAAATFAKAKQDLIINTAKDYFNVLLAKDTLRLTRAELRATRRQLDQAKQRYKVGLVAITNVYQTQASYDSIVASLISAKAALKNSREVLRQLTGMYYKSLAPLRGSVPLVKPNPTNVQTWVDTATHNNMNLMAAHFAAMVAKANIAVKFAGHMPTLTVIGSSSRTITDPTPAVTSQADTGVNQIDLQVAIPLFSGGNVTSQTHQAHYEYIAAVDNAEAIYRQVVSATRQNYNSILAGLSKIRADRQSIISHEASLKSTEAAYRVGTNTMIEVLDTQKDLYQAQQQHATDQYQYINDTLALKENAGTLQENDLQKINLWLRNSSYHRAHKQSAHKRKHKKMKAAPSKKARHPHKTNKTTRKQDHSTSKPKVGSAHSKTKQHDTMPPHQHQHKTTSAKQQHNAAVKYHHALSVHHQAT